MWRHGRKVVAATRGLLDAGEAAGAQARRRRVSSLAEIRAHFGP